MVTTRNAKRASSSACSRNVENLDPKTNNSSNFCPYTKRNVVKEPVKRRKRITRTPLSENVFIEGESGKIEERRSIDDEEKGTKKGGEFVEKHLKDAVPLLEPQSLPIWDPVDNWFDETKTSNVKKTFSRKQNLLR
ncbi:hypothetical protein Gasu2_30810 [Galdieria sulphuraria]|uniref:Uncharacterized protein n=1 Tax=Galdieria sulphuraria TaxID=130081 RepID=M2X545_GALSU|nr:uncharacterized protein Gasu_12750 [Galdieria sulphuraria]EME31605.1 hypothetical protein Gasu_12750 [Galdieria sulphuraria]GJD08793.1 hypothetical protein Gasu2_30810 [Galdieria sulphuraria]|eukprot:XP_005708125.1 hypothetical protein Gasu_12750 [Galdieria sulphuraria]